jgi:hypothetical protein
MNLSLDAERYTLRQTAKLVGVNLATVWRWCLHGARGKKLRSVHIGGRRFVLATDLDAFLAPAASTDSATVEESPALTHRAEAAERELDRLGL